MIAVTSARDAVLEAAASLAPARRAEATPGGKDDWSLDPRALAFLTSLVRELRPRRVLELGSGHSTVCLARAISTLAEPAELVTIESDPVHHRRTAALLDAVPGHRVRLLLAHLVARRSHGRYVPAYALATDAEAEAEAEHDALEPGTADLVLVDGPPLPLGGREGALHQALHASRCGAVIVLDDSRRDSERDLLVRLLSQFDGSLEAMDLLGFAKGLAVIVVTAPLAVEAT